MILLLEIVIVFLIIDAFFGVIGSAFNEDPIEAVVGVIVNSVYLVALFPIHGIISAL